MKLIRLLSLMLVLAFVLIAGISEAARIPNSAREQSNRNAAGNFSKLVRQVYCSLTSSQVVTPADITSTNTYSIAYCPSTVKAPVRVKIQYLGTGKIYKNIYESLTAGVSAPTATCAFLMDPINSSGTPVIGDEYDEIFYGTPNLSFGGGGSAATFTIEVYERPDFLYQD